MTTKRTTLFFLTSLVLLLAACDGDVSVGIKGPTVDFGSNISEPVTSVGVITATGSLRVNGVQYGTGAAGVTIDGHTGSVTDLQPGYYIQLTGHVDGLGLTGTARHINVDANIIGPAEAIDVFAREIVVAGQPVRIGSQTVFGSGIDPGDLSAIGAGAALRISGFADANGQLAATRIELAPASATAQLIGRVTGLDLAGMQFQIGSVTIDYSAALRIDLPDGFPVSGSFVIARGDLTAGVLQAAELSALHATTSREVRERSYLEGFVTSYTSGADFEVNGYPVRVRTSTRYENGARTDLGLNSQVRVYGRVDDDGQTVEADEIEFRHLADFDEG